MSQENMDVMRQIYAVIARGDADRADDRWRRTDAMGPMTQIGAIPAGAPG